MSALIAQQSQSLQDFQRSAPIQLYVALDTELAAADTTQLDKSRGTSADFLKGRAPDFDGSVDWQKAANPRIASMVTTEGQLVDGHRHGRPEHPVLGAAQGRHLRCRRLLRSGAGDPARRRPRAAHHAARCAASPSPPAEIGEELPRMVERMQTPGEGPGVVVDPIPVESDDEIGRLAAAFNTVNEVTLRVAKEQAALRASIAEMFVNVARRNQVLLGRQLAQLDKMEAREENPDLLKNLFRLDHLATRMRRNAESLLVLAGIDSTRRLRQSMPLSDVIRTARRRDRGVRTHRLVRGRRPGRLRPPRTVCRPSARRAARERHRLLQPRHPRRRRGGDDRPRRRRHDHRLRPGHERRGDRRRPTRASPTRRWQRSPSRSASDCSSSAGSLPGSAPPPACARAARRARS